MPINRSLLGRLTVRGALRVPEITVYFWVIKALSTAMGGLRFGQGEVALALTLAIFCLVAYLAVTRVDVQGVEPGQHPADEAHVGTIEPSPDRLNWID